MEFYIEMCEIFFDFQLLLFWLPDVLFAFSNSVS